MVMLDFEKVKPCSTGMKYDLLRGILPSLRLNVDGSMRLQHETMATLAVS